MHSLEGIKRDTEEKSYGKWGILGDFREEVSSKDKKLKHNQEQGNKLAKMPPEGFSVPYAGAMAKAGRADTPLGC